MCQLLIIDEKFLLGLIQLYYLDSCFYQIFLNATLLFGRINILLLEDFYQLSPIDKQALYDT